MATLVRMLPRASVRIPLIWREARIRLLATSLVTLAWAVRTVKPRLLTEFVGSAALDGSVTAAWTWAVRAVNSITPAML